MPKQLNVNLAFTADTGKAAAGIKQLQSQLTQLMNTAASNSASLGLTKDVKEATTAVAQLKAQLSNAMSSTGTLDLTKFNDSLKASGMTLEQYRTKLSALGPEGTAAFSQLASSIASAEIPIRRANGLLTELGTTLMNTARWQLSSSLLHGFIGGLQHAYGYAQDLNESLNNIRIVTGQSVDQMAQLAEKANKAAKELSTRTTDYTNASLIYYQQGLDDKAVEERTRTTLKLANVSRQSAEEVSTQMTAIWNNFDNGTKSLEYYADAITALGAKTASSSSEIAQGLSKFAAVADTIGLSYETATAALATVVAETRQSADVVGNAFKSIFSRLQSLKLGETLEDGVGLTKYSEALEKVGVKVLDINGELREADEIMSDLGERWTEISDTQKTALAQTVAGQRQYAQFVALFDNWDKVQQNIGIAEGSEGTLQDQADIYAESWEAASKRVQASAEAIYDALLDDKFFIGFNDFISKLLDGVNGLIKGFGGLGGTLTMLGALLTKTFNTQIAGSIDRIARNIQLSTKAGREAEQATQKQAITALEKEAAQAQLKGSYQGIAQAEGLKTQATLQQTLIDNQSKYNEEQLKTAQILLDNNTKLREELNLQGQIVDKEQARLAQQKINEFQKASSYANRNGITTTLKDEENLKNNIQTFEQQKMAIAELESSFRSFYAVLDRDGMSAADKQNEIGTIFVANFDKIKSALSSFMKESTADVYVKSLKTRLQEGKITLEEFKAELDNVFVQQANKADMTSDELAKSFMKFYQNGDLAKAAVDRLAKQMDITADEAAILKEKIDALGHSAEGSKKSMEQMSSSSISLGQKITSVASVLMSLSTIITSLTSIFDEVADSEKSVDEKFSSILSKLPSLIMSFGMLASTLTSTGGQAIITGLAGGLTKLIPQLSATGTAATVASGGVATLGQSALIIAPYIIALGVALGAVYAIFKHIESTSIDHKLQEAKKAAEEASQEFQNAEKQANTLKESFEKYQSIRDELDQCTTGTEEWRSKLEEVNQQVLNIIEQFPQLAQYMTIKDGVFTLDENGVKQYQDYQLYQKGASYWTQQESQQEVSELNAQKTFEDVTKGNYYADAALFYPTEQDFESAPNKDVYEELYRGAIEAAGDKLFEALDNGESFDLKTELPKIFAETAVKNAENNTAQYPEGLSYDNALAAIQADEDFENVINNFERKILTPLETAYNNKTSAENAEENLNPQIGQYLLSQNEDFMSKVNSAEVLSAAGAMVDQLLPSIENKYKENGQWDEKTIKEIYTGKYGEEALYRENEKGEKEEIDVEELVKILMSEDLYNQLPETIDQLRQYTNDLKTSGNEEKQAIAQILNRKELSGEEGKALYEGFSSKSYGELGESVNPFEEYLKELFNVDEKGLEEIASDAGFQSVEELINAFLEGMESYENKLDQAKKFGNSEVQAIYDNTFQNNETSTGKQIKASVDTADLDTLINLQDLVNSVFANAGTEGVQTLGDFFTENADQFDAVLDNIIESGNFTELINGFKDLGIEMEDDNPILDIFFNSLQKFRTLEDPAAKYAEQMKIISKLSEKGDTIEAEDYDKLDKSAQQYFDLMADGTYALNVDAETLKQTINETSFKDFQNKFQLAMRGFGEWNPKTDGKQALQIASMKDITSQYDKTDKEGNNIGESFYGVGRDAAVKQRQTQAEKTDYSSIQEILNAYNDVGTGGEHALGLEKAQEKLKELINTAKLGKDQLQDLKYLMEKGWINDASFEKGLHSIASTATSFEELDEIIQESGANTEIFTDDIIELLNQTGGSTEEKIAALRHELELGNGEASKLIKTMYELNGANDSEKTTRENIEENNKTNEENQKSLKTNEQKAESNKQAGLANINLIANADDMFDTDKVTAYYEELKKVQQGEQLTAMEARALGQAATQIFKDADFLGTEQQIKGIRDAFAAVDGEIEPENLKAYADAIKDLILNSNSMDLDQKLATIRKELTDAGVPIEYLNKELGELILADNNLTVDEKLEKIKNELDGDIPDELKQQIEEILINDSTTTEEAIQRIKEICGDDYELQHFSELIDKILNNNSTNTFEKLSQILNLIGEINGFSVDEAANAMAEQYDKEITSFRDFSQIKTNNDRVLNNQKESFETAKNENMAAQKAKIHGPQLDEINSQIKDIKNTGLENNKAKGNVDNTDLEKLNKQKEEAIALNQQATESQQKYDEELSIYSDKMNAAAQSYQLYANNLNGANFNSLEDLLKVQNALIDNGANISDSMQANDIIEYAKKFDSATSAIERYEDAISSGQEGTEELNRIMLIAFAEDTSAQLDLDAERVKGLAEAYQNLAQEEDSAYAAIKDNEQALVDLAAAEIRFSQGQETFQKNQSDLLEFMQDFNETLEQQGKQQAINLMYNEKYSSQNATLKKGLSDVLNISEDILDAHWAEIMTKEGKKLEKVIDGDQESLEDFSDIVFKLAAADLGVDIDTSDLEEISEYAKSIEGQTIDLTIEENWDELPDKLKEVIDAYNNAPTEANKEAMENALSAEGLMAGYEEVPEKLNDIVDSAAESSQALAETVEGGMEQGVEGMKQQAEGTTVSAETDVAETSGTEEYLGFDESTSLSYLRPSAKLLEEGGKDTKTVTLSIPEVHQSVTPAPVEEEVTKQTPLDAPKVTTLTGTGGGNIQKPSGGGRGGGCFIAGTLITTNIGFKNIEDIKVGDIVLSYNEKTQQNEYSEVLETMIHYIDDDIYTLRIENETIVTTGIHRFLITHNNYREWLPAAQIQVGDQVLFADGTLHNIKQINIEQQKITVYNFEVNKNHNYYVGQNKILVHNKGGCFIAGTPIRMRGYFKPIEEVQKGDIVLSYNEETNQNEYSIVAQTMIHIVNENIYTIQIENEQIVATGIHPFLITRDNITKWIIAEELKIGDLVLFADGTLHKIDKINVKIELKTVYNFEVNGNHNYYVGQNQILVHNKGRGGSKGRGRRAQQVRKETSATEGRVNTQKRYDTIDKTLSKLNDSYGKVNKVKDLAFGKKHLDAIQKEIDLEKLLLEQQTKRYNKSIEYLNKDKKIISTSNISDRLDKNGRLKAGDNGEGLASYEKETVTTRKKLTKEEQEEKAKLKKKKKKGKLTKAEKNRLTELKNITKKGIQVTSHDTQYAGVNINEILGGGTIDDYITKDDNGYQVNTDALNEKNDAKYNSFIAKYNEIMSNPNTSSKTKRKWENDKARQEALHQARQEYIEKIAEDIENAREDVNNIIDQQIQLLQSKIEEAVYEVDLKLDIDDSNLDILSEKIDRLGDSGRNAFATISLLGKEIEKLGEKSKTNIEGIEKIFSTIATKDNVQSVDEQNVAGQKDTQFTKDWGSSGFVNGVDIVKLLQSGEDSDYNTAWAALKGSADVGTITTEQLDEITERAKNQLDITKQIRETYFQMYEVLQNAMNFWSDELNRVLDKQQRILDTTKHYRNIIELIGGVNFEAMLKNGVAGNTLGMLGEDALVNANTKEYRDQTLENAKNQVSNGDQIRDLQRKTQAEMDAFAVQGNLELISSTKENQKFWEGQQKERATSVKTAKDNLDAAAANSQAKKQTLDEAKAAEEAARQTAAADKAKRDAADAEVKRTNQNKNSTEENARKANEKAQNSVKAAEDRLKAFQKEKESYSKAWQEQSQFEPMVIESGALGKGKGKGKTEIMSYTTATGINPIGKGPSIQEERRLELEVAKAKAEAESTSKAEAAKVSSAKKELELAQKNQKIAYDSLTKYQAAQANTVAKQKEYETEDKSYQEKQKDWEKTVELYNDATDKVNEATDRAQQAIEDTYESVATRYENAMQSAADKFNETLGKNAGTLDMLAEALERFSKVNSTHVQEYEKVHQLRMMDLEAEEAINKATDPKIKRELLAIQSEITAKTAKDQQMSQYDLDLLKKKLELKQAEAAMEDAKNAKTQVSLTRDNEGNFGYVYTADDNNVADAEKNYADKIYEMQKLNADYINSLQSEIVSVQQEAMQKIQELSTNSIMPPEEKQARILAVEADYQQLHEDLLGELQQALSDSNDVYGEYSNLYAEITGDLTATGLDHVKSFQETQLAIQTGYKDISEVTKDFQSATITYINNTRTAWNNYVTDVQSVQTTSGEDLSKYKEQATGEAGKIKESLEKITSEFKTIATEASSSLSTASTALETFKTDWVGKMGIAQTAAENLASGVNKIKTALIELKKETDEDNGGKNNNPPATNPPATNPPAKDTPAKDNRKDNVTVGRRRYRSRKAKNRRRKTVTTAKEVDALKEKQLKYKREYRAIMRSREYKRASRRQRKKLRQKAIRAAKDQIKNLLTKYKSVTVQFKSGGYTGTWAGQDGKMAMLHQKELVLNKEDTENILSAVNTIRDLSQSIDLNALASAGAFASMTAGGVGKLNNALDQHVSIEANFPNATSREEIQAAFENLIGLASQYANR